MDLFFIDCETGGLDPLYHSLLTVGIVHWKDGEILNGAEFKLKHDIYRCTGEALNVNGIDLSEHDKVALPYDKFNDAIKEFLWPISLGKQMIIANHNVAFDVGFLKENIHEYNRMFSYRTIDTQSIIRTFQIAGLYPEGPVNFSSVLRFYELDDSGVHNALFDATQAAKLYTIITNTLNELNNG